MIIMRRKFIESSMEKVRDEKGSIAVMSALMFTVLLMFAAIVIDIGMLYMEEAKLQNACDAAARAAIGVYEPAITGECPRASNLEEVRKEAKRIMSANGFKITDSNVIIDEANNTVEVTAKADVSTSFAQIINIDKLYTTKTAVASKSGGTRAFSLDYALFSGSETKPLSINGATAVTGGGVHTNNGVEYTGAGSSFYIENTLSYVQDEVNPGVGTTTAANTEKVGVQGMPQYHDAIMGALPDESAYIVYDSLDEYVSLNPGKLVNNTLTIDGNIKINNFYYCSYAVNITGNLITESSPDFANTVTISNRGSLYVKSDSGVVFRGSSVSLDGYLICKGDISLQNPCIMLGTNAYTQSVIYSMDKNVHFYGWSNTIYGMVYVPNGEVAVYNGYSIHVVNGGVVAYYINTSQGSLTINSNNSIAFDEDMVISSSSGSSGSIKLIK